MSRLFSSKVQVISDTTVFARYVEMMGSNDKKSVNLCRSVSWND